jgi:hypothetical protein
MILIGSRALGLRASSALLRTPADFDFVCSQQEYEQWLDRNANKIGMTRAYTVADGKKRIVEGQTNCEFEIIQSDTSSQLLVELVEKDPESIHTPFGYVPTFDLLFTLKASHKYLKNSPHFWKTLIDYHVMKKLGAKVRPEYQQFLKMREKETYSYQHPKLNQNKQQFFSDDQIQYVYDHDTIHQSVAIHDKPAYLHYMKDGAQVQTDKNKFFSAPRSIQLAGVIEEAAVLAIERSLVPHPGVKTPEQAWRFALSKVCSSITSGWFREFAYDNALEIIKLYPTNYWEKFQRDVASELVKPYTGTKY